ncbi:hypothetical protein D9M69_713770 [compost metagenome]
MANEQNIELVSIHAIDRQRRAIKRNRTFLSNKRRKLFRHAQSETDCIALVLARNDFRLPIDMSGHQMTAHFIAKLKRTLKINACAIFPF